MTGHWGNKAELGELGQEKGGRNGDIIFSHFFGRITLWFKQACTSVWIDSRKAHISEDKSHDNERCDPKNGLILVFGK